MLQAALWIALACAMCGALARNRVAWVLLASVAYCLYLDWAGVPFSVIRWLMLDASAMILIAMFAKRTLANCIIFALFFAGWAAYSLPDPYRYTGSVAITVIQLLLTFPLGDARQMLCRLGARWKANFRHRAEWTDLESREAHV
jgi:hypothetical protein